MIIFLGGLLLLTLHLRIKAAIYERETYKNPETQSLVLDKVLRVADEYILPVAEEAFGSLIIAGQFAHFVIHKRIQLGFVALSTVTTASRYAIRYKQRVSNVSEENATGLDRAFIIADEYVLPGLEFALICQPIRAVTFRIAKQIKKAARLSLKAGHIVKNTQLFFTATLIRSSLVYYTSLVKNLVHISIDYFLPKHSQLGSSLADDTFKEIPIIICKMYCGRKLICNFMGEITRETARLFVHEEKTILWSEKPGKAIAKTLHQYFERNVCVQLLGDQWGYVACGWTRRIFYEASSRLYNNLSQYLSQPPSPESPCMKEETLPSGHSGQFSISQSFCPAPYPFIIEEGPLIGMEARAYTPEGVVP